MAVLLHVVGMLQVVVQVAVLLQWSERKVLLSL